MYFYFDCLYLKTFIKNPKVITPVAFLAVTDMAIFKAHYLNLKWWKCYKKTSKVDVSELFWSI